MLRLYGYGMRPMRELPIPGPRADGQPRLMRTPRSLDLEITARCNLRCRYCYFFDNPALPYQDLPTGEWLRFFQELSALGVMDVFLTGGEPLLREDLPQLVQSLVDNRLRFEVASNGTLVDDKTAACFAQSGRCNYVQISLDGSCAETHDAGRGTGAFDAAVRGIRTLQRHGVRVTVRCTLHRHNVHDLESTVRLVLDELDVAEMAVNVAGYLGACAQNVTEVFLSVPGRQAAMETGLRLAQEYRGRLSANTSNLLLEALSWLRMEQARAGGAPLLPNGGQLTACGCPSYKLTIRPDGVMVPCSMLPHIALGRINQDSLAEVWRHSPALNRQRARTKLPLSVLDFCKDCMYTRYCSGGCPGPAFTRTGQVDHPNPDSCLWRFLQSGGSLANLDSDQP